MAKLHFRYGTMGSSKSAQLLMTRFNYIEKGRKVWLIKPAIDTRDGETVIKSRIGLEAEGEVIRAADDIFEIFSERSERGEQADVIIADECQFFTEEHILQLRKIVSMKNVPVICYGLRTDFRCKLFPGSRALFELADEIVEVKSICECGEKATVNARFGENGRIVVEGEQVELGGNDKYVSICWRCYYKAIHE